MFEPQGMLTCAKVFKENYLNITLTSFIATPIEWHQRDLAKENFGFLGIWDFLDYEQSLVFLFISSGRGKDIARVTSEFGPPADMNPPV